MPKNPTTGVLAVYPAAGGLESVSIPGATTPGRVVEGSNFVVGINGAKRKHPGCIRQDDGSITLAPEGYAKALFDHWRTQGNSKVRRTVLAASGKIFADNGDGAYIDITGAFSIIPYDNVAMEAFTGLLVLCFEHNPNNRPLKYDHTTLANMASGVPNGKYPRTWYGRLWIGGVPSAPDRLFGSVPDSPEDYLVQNGATQLNLDIGDQDPVGITGLFPGFFGRMIVGKRRSLVEITPVGVNTFGTREITSGSLGLVSHWGVAAGDNDQYFPSDRGIHSLRMTDTFGALESNFLSLAIQDFYQDNIAFELAANMRAIYAHDLNSYLLAATTKASVTNDVVLAYNIPRQEWSIWDENVSAFGKWVDPLDNNRTKILVLDDTGRVGYLDTKAKGNRVVTWFSERRTTRFATGLMFPIGANQQVTFLSLRCYFRPQTKGSFFTVAYTVDGGVSKTLTFDMSPKETSLIGEAVIGEDKVAPGGEWKEVVRELSGIGSAIQLTFSHTPQSDEEDCELYGFVIDYEFSGDTSYSKEQ